MATNAWATTRAVFIKPCGIDWVTAFSPGKLGLVRSVLRVRCGAGEVRNLSVHFMDNARHPGGRVRAADGVMSGLGALTIRLVVFT